MTDAPARELIDCIIAERLARCSADGIKVDRWQITHYGPPAFVKLDVGSSPVGTGARQGDRSEGVNMWNLNAITPETEKTTHYFWAQAWNFRLDEAWIGDMLKQQIHTIFLEDLGMIQAQQRNMDLGPVATVNLGQDKAWVAMRATWWISASWRPSVPRSGSGTTAVDMGPPPAIAAAACGCRKHATRPPAKRGGLRR